MFCIEENSTFYGLHFMFHPHYLQLHLSVSELTLPAELAVRKTELSGAIVDVPSTVRWVRLVMPRCLRLLRSVIMEPTTLIMASKEPIKWRWRSVKYVRK